MVERADKFENGYTTVRGIGLGDGAQKFGKKYFSGNYHVKFGHFVIFQTYFSGKNVLPP